MLYLVEEFYSIQGEGIFAGTPSIFFRFGGCNLKCQGFGVQYQINNKIFTGCDSYFAVNKNFKFQWKKIDSLDDFIQILETYKLTKHVVITGGEPLININNRLFLDFIQLLKKLDYLITIETNGTISIQSNINLFKDILFSISIKLSNSGEKIKNRLNLNALNSIITNNNRYFFKFTLNKESINNKNAEKEIFELQQQFPNSEIYCMPISQNKKELEENSLFVWQFALKYGYNYSDRLHIRIWDNKKGV